MFIILTVFTSRVVLGHDEVLLPVEPRPARPRPCGETGLI